MGLLAPACLTLEVSNLGVAEEYSWNIIEDRRAGLLTHTHTNKVNVLVEANKTKVTLRVKFALFAFARMDMQSNWVLLLKNLPGNCP